MENYLGETPIDISTHKEYKDYTPADWALHFIFVYGQIDGDHHKAWVLDQVARILKGTPIVARQARWKCGTVEDRISTGEPSQYYLDWVKEYQGDWDDEYEEFEYSYNEGIAP